MATPFTFTKRISMIKYGIAEIGDTVTIDDDMAERYEKRGWGTATKPAPKPKPTKKSATRKADD